MRRGRPSLTARWIAVNRDKLASTRPSTPSGNPEAEARLYQGFGRAFSLPGLGPTGLAVRTRFIDQEVANAIGGGTEQIVIVGAGYDGRALRFGGGATRWIEVDVPSTQTEKRRRLTVIGLAPEVTYAGVDLMTGDLQAALGAAAHQSSQPSLFICEGLFAYLPREVNVSVCRALRARAAAGSVLTFNVGVRPPAPGHTLAWRGAVDGVLSAIGERRRTRFAPGDAELLATASGWTVVRSQSSTPDPLDRRSHVLVLAAEPA